jgi:transposase
MSRRAVWVKRVQAWRASGRSAAEFCQGKSFAEGTLRWWVSRLKRLADEEAEAGAPDTAEGAAEVRLARVVRSPGQAVSDERSTGEVVVIESVRHAMRIAVSRGTDRETLAMVVEVLGLGGQP